MKVDPEAEKKKLAHINELERQIKSLQDDLDNNMGMNNMQRNQKRKQMQALMVERNKLLKDQWFMR